MIKKLITLSRPHKNILLSLVDIVAVIAVLLVAFYMRLWDFGFLAKHFWFILLSPLLALPIFVFFGLYRIITRYMGFEALWKITQAVFWYALIWAILVFVLKIADVPRSVMVINFGFLLVAISGVRILARWIFGRRANTINVAIVGAGDAGIQLLSALKSSQEFNPVAFLDDNINLQGRHINGVMVFALVDFEGLQKRLQISEVLLAIPSVGNNRRNQIIDFLTPFPVLVRSVPGVSELAQGLVKIADLREVSIKDLLGRDSVSTDQTLLSRNITDKVVLVSGAGGSIGAELCRQIIVLKPKLLLLLERSEIALYDIEKNLQGTDTKVLPLLGSVNNAKRLSHIFERFKPDTIYHAAAYKHVPMVEFNNSEGVDNNIFGTLTLAETAIAKGVATFVLISTDKAVRPTNIMGATKRLAELCLQALAKKQETTDFSMVRFGNVLGSSGSVIPLFRQQISDGGPITITDPKMLRYFMTVSEAALLVIQAGAMGHSGNVFVLDMGEAVSIQNLAEKMIRLSGLTVKNAENPDGDIEIKHTGIRPGEKLFEELLIAGKTSKTTNPGIWHASETFLDWSELQPILTELSAAVEAGDNHKIRQLLIKAVPEFTPMTEIVDLLHQAK